jgi:hypothetical protein
MREPLVGRILDSGIGVVDEDPAGGHPGATRRRVIRKREK